MEDMARHVSRLGAIDIYTPIQPTQNYPGVLLEKFRPWSELYRPRS